MMHELLKSRAVLDASIAVALETRFDSLAHEQAAVIARYGRPQASLDGELWILRRIVRDAATLRRMRAERETV